MSVAKSERLISLDVFRGITIAGMILVNSPGTWSNVYPALLHSKWNGCTPTDMIFPFFMFIVGVAITYSISKRIASNDPVSKIVFQVIRRSIIIFLLGLFLNGFPYFNIATLRIPGVLQRIAVAYLVSSIIFLRFDKKIISAFILFILLIYWAFMTLLPVPGVGFPGLGPTNNLGAWLDRLIFGNHLWAQSQVWDPEGLLSSFSSISTVLIGVLTGYLLKNDKNNLTKTIEMFVWGNILVVAGIIWDIWFPINKNLWTSSYVLYTAGLALNFLGMCYWFIDVKGYKKWSKPFLVFGMNAIAAYFLSEFIEIIINVFTIQSVPLKDFIFKKLFLSWISPINASLLWAICYVIILFGLMSVLYRKKIFVKI
jgi:predicted acyltransferase